MMRAPDFWYEKRGLLSLALAPLGQVYAYGTARRLARGTPEAVGVPVICIGNLTVGGTGKTPTAIAVAQILQARGFSPAFLSRGYGGEVEGPHLVDERKDNAKRVGDEPLLLSAFAPTWISRDRLDGAKAAAGSGADVIIMDDGFQNPALSIDIGLVVIDASKGFGNGRCLPAGPLREPVNTGLMRADAVISIGSPNDQSKFEDQTDLPKGLPVHRAVLEPLQTGMDWAGLKVLAFAGIGNPNKFFRTLKDLGAEVVEAHGLSDHQPLDNALLTRLSRRAEALGARLVATEKDAVRLPQEFRTEVLTLPVRLKFENQNGIETALKALKI